MAPTGKGETKESKEQRKHRRMAEEAVRLEREAAEAARQERDDLGQEAQRPMTLPEAGTSAPRHYLAPQLHSQRVTYRAPLEEEEAEGSDEEDVTDETRLLWDRVRQLRAYKSAFKVDVEQLARRLDDIDLEARQNYTSLDEQLTAAKSDTNKTLTALGTKLDAIEKRVADNYQAVVTNLRESEYELKAEVARLKARVHALEKGPVSQRDRIEFALPSSQGAAQPGGKTPTRPDGTGGVVVDLRNKGKGAATQVPEGDAQDPNALPPPMSQALAGPPDRSPPEAPVGAAPPDSRPPPSERQLDPLKYLSKLPTLDKPTAEEIDDWKASATNHIKYGITKAMSLHDLVMDHLKGHAKHYVQDALETERQSGEPGEFAVDNLTLDWYVSCLYETLGGKSPDEIAREGLRKLSFVKGNLAAHTMEVSQKFNRMKDQPMAELDKIDAYHRTLQNPKAIAETRFHPSRRDNWQTWAELYKWVVKKHHSTEFEEVKRCPQPSGNQGGKSDDKSTKTTKKTNKRKGSKSQSSEDGGGSARKKQKPVPKSLGVTLDQATRDWYHSHKKCFRCAGPFGLDHVKCRRPAVRATDLPAHLHSGWKAG